MQLLSMTENKIHQHHCSVTRLALLTAGTCTQNLFSCVRFVGNTSLTHSSFGEGETWKAFLSVVKGKIPWAGMDVSPFPQMEPLSQRAAAPWLSASPGNSGLQHWRVPAAPSLGFIRLGFYFHSGTFALNELVLLASSRRSQDDGEL